MSSQRQEISELTIGSRRYDFISLMTVGESRVGVQVDLLVDLHLHEHQNRYSELSSAGVSTYIESTVASLGGIPEQMSF